VNNPLFDNDGSKCLRNWASARMVRTEFSFLTHLVKKQKMKTNNAPAAVTTALTLPQVDAEYEIKRDYLSGQIRENGHDIGAAERRLKDLSFILYGTDNFTLDRSKQQQKRDIAWLVGLFVVATVEIPFNYSGLQVFGIKSFLLYPIAAVFGFACAIGAHFSGYGFKRYEVAKRNKDQGQGSLIMGLVVYLAAIILFFGMAYYRKMFMINMDFKAIVPEALQVAVSVAIFTIGVAISYWHTSNVRNLTTEENFKAEMANLNELKGKKARFAEEVKALGMWYTNAKNAVENAGNQRIIDEHNHQADLQTQTQLTQQQAASDQTERTTRFNRLLDDFKKDLMAARKIYDGVADKSSLGLNTEFSVAYGKLESHVAEMEDVFAKGVNDPDAETKIQNAKDEMNKIKA